MAGPIMPGRMLHLERLETDPGTEPKPYRAAPCHAAIVAGSHDTGLLLAELSPISGTVEWHYLRDPSTGGWHWPPDCEYTWPEW